MTLRADLYELLEGVPDERIRRAVAEAEADPRPSVPHESVARWLRSWGTENELSSPNEN